MNAAEEGHITVNFATQCHVPTHCPPKSSCTANSRWLRFSWARKNACREKEYLQAAATGRRKILEG